MRREFDNPSPALVQHPARCRFETVRPGGRRCILDAHEGPHKLISEEAVGVSADDCLERVLWLAEEHGRKSEPDHEVGDLQDALALAWHHLNPIQREVILSEVEEKADESWR